ncbi:unnamed protein product [Adineta steineri]|uniref:T4 RNA ligase 1-like N-terminal domain-containing protein n=2 Tax=Adineta steineri TaxID=433720 RepID=A0A814NCR0_9BILA|nr:unnamed protein product [Adineta steineri]CAF4014699.1 unnamed protein product [Adineta steineri]
MCDSILLPKIIANLEWSEARELLETKYGLVIDETDKLFCAKYIHGSHLWTRGTEEQKTILAQNRGAVYEKMPPYRLVCLPFYKFWNYNEPNAITTNDNWTSYTAKMDGSFFKVYFFQNEWYVSSNSRIDIKQLRKKYTQCGKTNEQLWQEAALEAGFDYSKLNQRYAYFFERVHPDYKIVIQYEKPMLYHLGTRDMLTLEEIEIDIGIPKPRSLQFSQLNQCVEYVNQMSFMEGEGIVACDTRNYHRIKIKSPSYLIIHYGTVGVENENKTGQFCLSIWLQGEQQEYLNYFPKFIQEYNEIEKRIEESIIPQLINEFTKLYSSETKTFFDNLNKEYPSSGKPNQDRKRLIFTKLFQQNQGINWNQLDNEHKCTAVRNILRQRNIDNTRKFIFEKYLHLLITI